MAKDRNCPICDKGYRVTDYYIRMGKKKYCSKECYTKAQIGGKMAEKTREKISAALSGRKTWNTGMKGYTNGGSWQKGQTIGGKNWNWRGDNVGYLSLHTWVSRKLGKPTHCERCGDTSERKYEWANISRQYKRDLLDWMRLCVPCHSDYDQSLQKAWNTRRIR